ncbi:ZWICHEL kinesin-like calmodulin-binding protein, partial [Prunus dulcis]
NPSPSLATTATSCRHHHHHTQPLGAAPGPLEPPPSLLSIPPNHLLDPPPCTPESATKGSGLDRFTKLSTLRSLSFLHQIGRVRYQEPDRILKGDLRGIEAVEVCGIHHRANYSFRAKVKILG